MPYYSDEIVEEVRSKTDIVDVISQYVNLQKRVANTLVFARFIMKRQVHFLLVPRSRCITALDAEPEVMFSAFL